MICIDAGAGSVRTFLCEFNGRKVKTKSINRFSNKQIFLGNTLYFDFFHMIRNIEEGINLSVESSNKQIDSIGVDSFGASFGLIDKEGELMANPISYRDSHYRIAQEAIEKIIMTDCLDELNMSKTYPHCSLFLLYYLYHYKKKFAQAIDYFLPIANLINFYLGGETGVDHSILSGTQFFNVSKREYIIEVLNQLDIDSNILPEIRDDYSIDTKLKKSYLRNHKIIASPKISLVCSHDTASAVAGLPLCKNDAFIISGTWSVIGVEGDKPMDLAKIKNTGFTNWNGYKDLYLFVKIYSGFYFFQELKKIWQKLKNQIIDDDIFFTKIPLEGSSDTLINLNSSILFDERINMFERIIKFIKNSKQRDLLTLKSMAESIIKSIVMEYRIAFKELEAVCGYKIEKVYITGGGSKNSVFCSWLSSAVSKEIISGYTESAINGNLVCQLINLKEVSCIKEGRDLIRASFKEIRYNPLLSASIDWDYLENKYLRLKDY